VRHLSCVGAVLGLAWDGNRNMLNSFRKRVVKVEGDVMRGILVFLACVGWMSK
jgi:hypothetical protein